MRSIEKDSSYENGSQKVLRILKINHPVAKDVVDKMTNKYLLPKGVEKNKIEQNLTANQNESNSSRKRRNPSTSSFVCQGITTCLSRAVSKGSSFCEIDDVVKRLSFVFLVVSENESPKLHAVNNEGVERDSRGSYFKVNSSPHIGCRCCSATSEYKTNCFIPAYLIVFELESEYL